MIKKLHYFIAIFAFFCVQAYSANTPESTETTGTPAPTSSGSSKRAQRVQPNFPKGDPVLISDVKVSKARYNQADVATEYLRFEILLEGKYNPDEKSTKDWIRNVEVELVVIYEDDNAKESRVAFKSIAKMLAVKATGRTPVVFIIPGEAAQIYRLAPEPLMYTIGLKVLGTQIELSPSNYKKLLSKKLASASNPVKALEFFKVEVDKASSLNEGVLVPLNRASFPIQSFEYLGKLDNAAKFAPTYISDR